MENYWWCAILFRLFLPSIIVAAAFFRPTLTSYVYVVMGCYLPFFSIPTSKSMKSETGSYLKLLIVVCMLTCSLVLSFYFLLYFPAEREYDLDHCGPLEKVIRMVGIVEFENLPIKDTINWCLPEPLMLITSTLLYLGFKRLTETSSDVEVRATLEGTAMIEAINKRKMWNILLNFGKYLVCFLLCLTAVLKPNAIGMIYYTVFLGVLTYWACNNSLGRNFARVITCLIPIFFLHISMIFLYQLQYFQDSKTYQTDSLYGRLLHLVPLKTYKSCTDPRLFKVHRQSKATYAMPFFLFILYHISISVVRQTLEAKDGIINLLIAFFNCWQDQISFIKWKEAVKKIQDKIENEKSTMTENKSAADKIKSILDQIFEFVLSISHLAANFLMMLWAIAFPGWKSLILLIIANLVWLMPSRKKMMTRMSPILAIFMHFLLVNAYIYSLNVTEKELPSKVGIVDFRSGILKLDEQKWIELLSKSLFGVIIFISMRQLLQERSDKKKEEELIRASGPGSSKKATNETVQKPTWISNFQTSCVHFFAIWWIWIVILMMIWIEFFTVNSLFRIAFVGLAFVFLLTFQLCPFAKWKKFLWFYWWIVIIYAMFNLLVLYMYQLSESRNILLMILSKEKYEAFGCRIWTDRTECFFALSNPLFFQIAVVMQQNYFQKEFDKITSISSPQDLAEKQKYLQQLGAKWRKFKTTLDNSKNILFAVLEVHLPNIILMIGWYMCVFDLCAIFAPFVLLFTIACVLGRRFSKVIIYLISCLVQIFIILRLVYMKQYRHHASWNFVGHYKRNGKTYNVTLNTADWLGFHESSSGKDFANFGQLAWCFIYVFAVTVDRIVTIRMNNYRKSRNLPSPQEIVLFPDITYENSYSSIGSMLKFLANYGFYKLGCEITFVYASIVMGMRMDAIAIPISLWLLIMFSLNRVWLKRLWLPFLLVLVIIIPVQYVNTLGWWPTLFYESRTLFWNSNDILLRIQQFCHIMNMAHPPIKEKISQDFIFLLIMSRQWLAFKREWKNRGKYSPAGSNESVCHLIDDLNVKNPVPDFTTYTKNYLDTVNHIIFNSWFYLSLMATFMAGAMRPSIYSFGFILISSIFLWEGSDIFLRPGKKILLRWNLLIAYNILVMMARTVSQIFGCILRYDVALNCEVYRFFAVGCVDKYHMTQGIPNISAKAFCQVDYEALGLGWDCFCFFCLICQQRIFKSYYFIHIVNDAKAHTILANKGAELIEETRIKKREAVDIERIAIENNIKKKLERIKANSKKIDAIRAGEYYYFDEVDKDTDIPLLPEKEEEEEEYESYDPMPLGEFFGLFFFTNMTTVLEITDMRSRRKKALKYKMLGKAVDKSKLAPKSSTASASGSSHLRKLIKLFRFLWACFESLTVSIIGIIDRTTKEYRRILNQIHKYNVVLKEKTPYNKGVRLGSNNIWYPLDSYKNVLDEEKNRITKDLESLQYSIYWKLLRAIWYLFMAYSEWLCYLLIILYQTMRGNFISLPMLIMTFCWGALTVPKPTKTFWIVNIAYALIMVLIKNFFDMGAAPWHKDENKYNTFFPPALIGLFNKMKVLNLLLLTGLFFHRAVLIKLGLWKPYEYRIAALIENGDYYFKDGVFVAANAAERNQQILTVQSVEVAMGDYFPKSVFHGLRKYAEGFALFIQQLINPLSTQIPVDVYLPMFLCDLINLLLLLFFYGLFQNELEYTGLIDFVRMNRVPLSFIVTVLSYIFSMMIDRGLYLRRNRYGKLVYHYLQVFAVHIWFFIVDPLVTNRNFRDTPVVQTFYVFKCFYFLFSAYQIRNGYPTIISYHYLWHGYTVFHRFGYKVYRIIPYFLEIRCLFDWIVCDSCLTLPAWFKMEDVTQSLFDQKCQQEFEARWSQSGGQRVSHLTKYLLGGILYLLLVLTVIFPFLLFSLSSTMGIATKPQKIKMELYMGRAQPIFEAYTAERDIIPLSKLEYENLSTTFNNIPNSEDIFDEFTHDDVLVVKWSGNSLTTWDISPGSKRELLEELNAAEHFMVRLEIHYVHIGNGGEESEKTFGQSTFIPPLPDENRRQLINMLQSKNDTNYAVWLPLLFPKFLRINQEGTPQALNMMETNDNKISTTPLSDLASGKDGDDDADLPADTRRLRNLLIALRRKKSFWWQVSEECNLLDDNYLYYLINLVHNSCDKLVIFLFNEKVFSSTMNYMTRSGILGLYLLYFMVVIEVIRACRANVTDIWIKELPNSNKLLRKCMEIYVARDMKNYELESEIVEEIICIMRSREIIIKLTRYEDNNYDPTFITPGTSKK